MRLLHVDGDEEALLAALLFEAVGRERGGHAHPPGRARAPTSARALLGDLVGERANRRHRPGRGFEALRYRFEVVSDYGAFRDLQRHRMLTVQWQRLTPHLGAGVPEEVDAAGCGDDYPPRARGLAPREWERLAGAGREREALVRAVPGLPHPLRARPQRARGDAARSSCARAARAIRATARSPTRCTG